MKEKDSLVVTSLLDRRLQIRHRLAWAGDPDLVQILIHGTEHVRMRDMTEEERRVTTAVATRVMQSRLDDNTAALAALGITIEEDDA